MKQDVKQEPIQIEGSYCETIEEVIKSADFSRVFWIILKSLKKYDVDYFSGILQKIQKSENLSETDENDMTKLLQSIEFQKEAEKVSGKLKWFTKNEFEQFFKNYSVTKLIDEIKNKSNIILLNLNNGTPVVIEGSFETVKWKTFKILSTNINWNRKMCLRKDWEPAKISDFKIDTIEFIWLDWRVLAKVWDKKRSMPDCSIYSWNFELRNNV